MFSAVVTDTLEWAGWSPTRKVSMTRWVKALIDDGYTMVPEALRILENFGLLTIKPPPKAPGAVFRADELVFRPDDAALGEGCASRPLPSTAGRDCSWWRKTVGSTSASAHSCGRWARRSRTRSRTPSSWFGESLSAFPA